MTRFLKLETDVAKLSLDVTEVMALIKKICDRLKIE